MNGDTETEPTQEELIARIYERRDIDTFGFEWPEYAVYLSRDNVEPFLASAVKSEPKKWSRESIIMRMAEYLPFAFEKANERKGVSATRSVMYYVAWTWLCGDREFSEAVWLAAQNNYAPYGKPVLRMIAEHYGWDWRSLDE